MEMSQSKMLKPRRSSRRSSFGDGQSSETLTSSNKSLQRSSLRRSSSDMDYGAPIGPPHATAAQAWRLVTPYALAILFISA